MSRGRLFVGLAAAAVCGLFVQFAIAAEALPKRYTETVSDRLGEKMTFDMVLIDGGRFTMGSPDDEAGRKPDEGPQREVRVSPFYLCTTEMTLKFFLAYYEETSRARAVHVEAVEGKDVDAITGPTPVFGELTMGYSPNHPAIGGTWHNAVTFCQWLSKKTGRTYRLPTEAEWEYAARAGGTTAFAFGADKDNVDDYAWYADNSDGEVHAVASKKPNAWGLYDMAGNVREWVQDFYAASYDGANAVNPKGPESGAVHVARGGDYDSPVEELRSAARAFEEKWWRSGDPQIPKSRWWLPNMDIVGFRVACSIEPENSGPAFEPDGKGGFTFDTGVLKGTLRSDGKSVGLSDVVHVPSGKRLDRSMGMMSHYRVFTKGTRHGTAAWDWPSEAQLGDDGAVRVTWAKADGRPFELAAVYRWRDAVTLDVETFVTAAETLEDFESFVAVYCDAFLASPYVYVNSGFMQARQAAGDWQVFPRGNDVVEMIQDGRWEKEPHPVAWTVRPHFGQALAFRKGAKAGPGVVVMAPPQDCFAISTPYSGESHYSLYLSLFGGDVAAGTTAQAKARLVITTETTPAAIGDLYRGYLKDLGR
ncbi:MAG: SUMF1/EgtB/PvdO family nonheme iron enzyme [Phycisphaerae bacterium]|nr:SUMF1/EgtB/PvdO family nonheme iron enzyme [Phycisphaerae bacterium]